jgi:hypothetical protein
VVAQERGDFDQMARLASQLGATADRVQDAYRSAASWASAIAHAA